LRLEDAQKILKRPYVTERTFDQIEKENKLCFIVDNRVNKKQIAGAVEALYEVKVREVNTARTIKGKKAFVRLAEAGTAANIASRLGLV
jgi:large subunit ribosomal protein L23